MATPGEIRERLFNAAAEMIDTAQRKAFLDAECGDDAQLRADVEALLRHDDAAGRFLLTAAAPSTLAEADDDGVGTQIGPYKLLEKIGEGGFGLVYLAEQSEPVRRTVALKVLKPGMDSREVLARFSAERQALALMDHPNIAKFYDAGVIGQRELATGSRPEKTTFPFATSDSRPYFVMELVQGVSITQFCNEHRLSPHDRLEIFVTVCQAVQHAHQKGVIHRDLKPSNVLVAEHDGRPVAKVIDFGVAKAIGTQLTDQTIHTQIAQMIGTPLYMSPEQAEMGSQDIDTRSDIYSLGVMLYELLTGTTPFDKARLRKAAYDEIRRVIREEEPEKPSTRLSHENESLPSVAAQRQTEPAKLSRLVRGDLDWITMKCLEKDRSRRYETANGLAMDLQRYLADEPVLAGPPTATYRLKKFVRRNKGSVIAATGMLALLIAGIIGTTWGMIRANAARAAEAERANGERLERLRADKERDRANDEMRVAQAIGDFLRLDLLRQANPHWQAAAIRSSGSTAKVQANPGIKEVLDWAAGAVAPGKIEAKFPKQPRVQAEVLKTIGETYNSLGEFQKSIEYLERASAICSTALGTDHRTTLDVTYSLGGAYQDVKRVADAVRLWEQAVAGYERLLGKDEPPTLTSMMALAGGYLELNQHADAIRLYEHVHLARQRKFGVEAQATLRAGGNVGRAYFAAGRLDDAIRQYEHVRDIQLRTIGIEHPDTQTTFNNLGQAYTHAGRTSDSVAILETLRDVRSKQLDADHPDLLITFNNLARAYEDVGRLPDATRIWADIVPKARRKFGPAHPYPAGFLRNWINALDKAGKMDQVVQVARDALTHDRSVFAPNDVKVAKSAATLGQALMRAGKPVEAEPYLRESLTIRLAAEPDAWTTFQNLVLLGSILFELKKYDEAESLLVKGFEGLMRTRAAIPQASATIIPNTVERLIQLYDATGKPEEAAKWRTRIPNP